MDNSKKLTPKEKARELVKLFKPYSIDDYAAFTNAYGCVNEIINAHPTETVDGALFTIHPVNGMVKVDNTKYWQQVKQELQKL